MTDLGILDLTVPEALAQRLRRGADAGVGTVVACATDGVPLVSTRRRGAGTSWRALGRGLRAALQATGADRGIIVVEARARELSTRPTGDPHIEVRPVPDVVAAGIPKDLDPAGLLLVDALALVELGLGRPVTDRMVTVAGDVARPAVRRVPIGTCIEEVVAAAGGATCGPAWVALHNGPLGNRLCARDEPIGKTTTALTVVAGRSDLARRVRTPLGEQVRRALSVCQGCAQCGEVCPPQVRPDVLLRGLATGELTAPALQELQACTGCGICDLACPTGLRPSALVAATARTAGTAKPWGPARRLSLSLAALRLGLAGLNLDPPWDPDPIRPRRVLIPLAEMPDAPAAAVIRPGDRVTRGTLVAAPGQVPMHASMDGVVVEVSDEAIVIEREVS